MLDVPETHSVLWATDSHGHIGNGFDSDHRLQAILNKTGSNVEHRIWVVAGLWYIMARGKYDKEVSAVRLDGSQRTSNKGLCDLLIYKHSIKRQVFQREAPRRANDILINTDVPSTKRLDTEVEPRTKTLRA